MNKGGKGWSSKGWGKDKGKSGIIKGKGKGKGGGKDKGKLNEFEYANEWWGTADWQGSADWSGGFNSFAPQENADSSGEWIRRLCPLTIKTPPI